jgi:hypothetical protein
MKKNIIIGVMSVLFICSTLTAYNLYISNNKMYNTIKENREYLSAYRNYYKCTENFIDYLSNEYALNILDVDSETDEGAAYLQALDGIKQLKDVKKS